MPNSCGAAHSDVPWLVVTMTVQKARSVSFSFFPAYESHSCSSLVTVPLSQRSALEGERRSGRDATSMR